MKHLFLRKIWGKRILSFVLCMSMLAAYLPHGIMAETVLDTVELTLPVVMELSKKAFATLTLTDTEKGKISPMNAACVYEIVPEGIVSVNDSGIFTAEKLGSATVTAKVTVGSVTKSTSVHIAVVGTDLFKVSNVDQGGFESGIATDSIWEITNVGKFMAQAFEETDANHIQSGEKSLKIVFDAEQENQRLLMNLKSGKLLSVDPNHLYEMSGYVKCENITKEPKSVMQVYYYTGNGVVSRNYVANSMRSESLYSTIIKPGTGWQAFSVPVCVPMDASIQYMSPKITSENVLAGGTYWYDDLRFREVVFDRVDFAIVDTAPNMEVGKSFATSVKFYTNTGNELVFGKDIANVQQSATVIYQTTNDKVAIVDEKGSVSLIGVGRAEITAETMIAGITCKGSIPVAVPEDSETLSKAIDCAILELESTFEGCSEANYTSENWTLVVAAKDQGLSNIRATITSDEVQTALSSAKKAIADITQKSTEPTIKRAVLKVPEKMALYTTAKASVTLFDSEDTEVSTEGAQISYRTNPEDIIQITSDGTVSAKKRGETSVSVSVTRNGETVESTPVTITVSDSGVNLMAGSNFDFETDAWAWLAKSGGSGFIRYGIETCARGGNANNRALAIQLNADVVAARGDPLRLTYPNRIEVEEGKFYELSFWTKIETTIPSGASEPNYYVDLYAYKERSGETSGDLVTNTIRNIDLSTEKGYPTAYGEWKRVVIPVAAPITNDKVASGKLYVTPRIDIRAKSTDMGKTGFLGTIWVDDMSLSEVGFDHVEASVAGNTAAIGDKSTLTVKPYATTGNLIALLPSVAASLTSITSTNDSALIVGAPTCTVAANKLAVGWMTAPLTVTELQSAAVKAEITLSGITRDITVPVLDGIPPITVPEKIEAGVKAGFAEIGGKTQITITADGAPLQNGVTCTYTSKTPETATVSEKGEISGVRLGHATIHVAADFGGTVRETDVMLSIVGENLLTRDGMENGRFENNAFLSTLTPITDVKNYLWRANKAVTGKYERVTNSFVKMQSPLHSDANVLKMSLPQTESPVTTDISRMLLEVAEGGGTNDKRGFISIDKNKIYEFTGWVKSDNVQSDKSFPLFAEVFFYSSLTELPGKCMVANQQIATTTYPWQGKLGSQDWTMFTTNPVIVSNTQGVSVVGANTRVNHTEKATVGDIYVSDLSYHEVRYDKLTITGDRAFFGLNPGDRVMLKEKHFTNTGHEIPISVDETSAKNQYPIPVVYTSSNEKVATVSDGELLACGGGEAEITATATLFAKTENETVVTTKFNVSVTGTPLSEFSSVSVEVPDRIARKTKQYVSVKLLDDTGKELSADGSKITFVSDDEKIFTVDEGGTITAVANGTANLRVSATLGEVTNSASVPITVADIGINLCAGINFDFETDTWTWLAKSGGSSFVTYDIGTCARGGNANNRALGITMHADIAAARGDPLRLTYPNRVEVEEGKFYELSFWTKIETTIPSSASEPNYYVDLYGYNERSGETSDNHLANTTRNIDLSTEKGYPTAYGEWKRVVIPVAAPLINDKSTSGKIYITPRIDIRVKSADMGKTGFSGTIWIDDVTLTEVGFNHVEASVSGNLSDGEAKLEIKPYATSGNLIAMLYNQVASYVTVSSSNKGIVVPGEVLSTSPTKNKVCWATCTLKNSGKNGSANVTAFVTLNDETRETTVPLEVEGKTAALDSVTLQFDKGEYAINDTVRATLIGLMTDGKTANLTDADIIYTSSKPDVFEVKEDGRFLPKAEGVSDVTVSVTLSGVTISTKVAVSVIDTTPLKAVVLTAPETVDINAEATLTVTGTMTSGNTAYLPNAQISYEITNQSAEGAITLDQSGKVIGKKVNTTASIKAKMTMRGVTVVSNETTIRVIERKPLNVTLTVLKTSGVVVPVGTAQKLDIRLLDAEGEEIAKDRAEITYSVSSQDAAEVMDDGTLILHKLGTLNVYADVTVGLLKERGTLTLDVQNAGDNLLSGCNPSFDTDDWAWENPMENEPNGKFMRTTIGTVPRGNDAGNRALGLRMDPSVAPKSYPAVLRLKFKKRPEVKVGALYELSFYMKLDAKLPAGAQEMNNYIDLYAYTNRTGESASDLACDLLRNTDLKTYTGYPEKYRDWVKVTIPVPAPLESKSPTGEVYITPRIAFRPNSADLTKIGFDGVLWLDDFSLREVGVGEIKTELSGDQENIGDVSTLEIRPYTTTGTQIAIQYSKVSEVCNVTSSDKDIVTVSSVASTATSNIPAWESTKLTVAGKNGTAEIAATLKLAGITKTVKTMFTIKDLPIVLRSLVLDVPKSEMLIDDTQKMTVSGIMTDLSQADLTGARFAYYSSDEDTVAIDQEGNITALREGESTLHVDVNLKGIIRSVETLVTVRDTSALSKATLTAPKQIAEGRPVTLEVSGLMESGKPLYVPNAEVTYSVVRANPEDCVTLSDDGIIIGVSAGGEAEIKAKVTLRGKTLETNSVTVHVVEGSPSDVVIDFKSNQSGTPLTATFETHGWRTNREKTSSRVQTMDKGFRFLTYGIQSQITAVGTPVEADSAFDVNIPYTGDYTFSMSGGNFASGAIVGVFIDNEYVGEYNFFNISNNINFGPTVTMKSMHLQSGAHTVILRSIGRDADARSYNQYPGCMTFTGVSALPNVEVLKLAPGQETLGVSDKIKLSACVYYTNGVVVKAEPGLLENGAIDTVKKATFENLTPDILAIDASGNLTALTEGIGKVKISAFVDGSPMTTTCEIQVSKQILKSISLTADKTQLFVGDTCGITAKALLANGTAPENVQISYASDREDIISVKDGVLTAHAIGDANITATATFGGVTIRESIAMKVVPDGLATLTLSADATTMKPSDPGSQIHVIAKSNTGVLMPLDGVTLTYQSDNEAVVTVSESGFVTPVGIGSAKVTVNATIGTNTASEILYFSVSQGKTKSTLYTTEKIANARENIEKYFWARNEKDAAVKLADNYVIHVDQLWNLVPQEGLPRAVTVGFVDDPEAYTCRYCGEDLRASYGSYPWIVNPLGNPYKIKCPNCRRQFPSNDFEKYYQSGIDAHGNFSSALAQENGQEYLKNILYPEKGEGWGVDDGFGYKTGRVYTLSSGKRIEECHTYIAYYMHYGLWCPSKDNNPGIIIAALNSLRDAYLYTGNARYGQCGAILIDRVADVYPAFDLTPYYNTYCNSNGGSGEGKVIGRIWEAQTVAPTLARAYDAFFPAMDDPEVVRYLSEKATIYQFANNKSTPDKIRKNGEDGILRAIYDGCKNASIYGNFGMHQSALAAAAVALDTMPETKEWIDYIMGSGSYTTNKCTGGNVLPQIINDVSRDGHGNEAAPGYNNIWLTSILQIAEALNGYEGYTSVNLYEHPKVRAMLTSFLPLIMCGRAQVAIGDSGGTASLGSHITTNTTLTGFLRCNDPTLAQACYWANGNSTNGLHADIFTKNPEAVQGRIEEIIRKQGEFDFGKSSIQAGYGLMSLRDGEYIPLANSAQTYNTQRDFWLYFGRGDGHGHPDSLNLGIEAYGLNMAPDLGYPEATGKDENRWQWVTNTISHNTVVVNETKQTVGSVNGTPMHFEDAGRVKVMDVDAEKVYPDASIYRRTVVMVKVDDEVSYGLDFFRIQGGYDHLYSFHSQSDEIASTENLNLIAQVGGSYAGVNVPWGPNSNYMNGYTWLEDVRTMKNLKTNDFSVDFKVKDFRNVLPTKRDLHLNMTMLNDFALSEVSIAKGTPPRLANNAMVNKLEYVLARRHAKSGEKLDTLFTTVFEPYENERYIESLARCSVERSDGAEISENEKVAAIRVTFKSGRVDYVIYAADNTISYLVDGRIPFCGFIGVVSGVNEKPAYSYLNDGTTLGDMQGCQNAVSGTVSDFTKKMTMENSITMTLDTEIDVEELTGRYVQIENDGYENAFYPIEKATSLGNKSVKLDIGGLTLIRKCKDINDLSEGYVYNIEEGARGKIALTHVTDTVPIIQTIPKKRVDVGFNLKFKLIAESPSGRALTYSAKSLPRGAQFDAEKAEFTWYPDDAQVGRHSATFEVSDGVASTNVTVDITVYNRTTHKEEVEMPLHMNDEETLAIDTKALQSGAMQVSGKYVDMTIPKNAFRSEDSISIHVKKGDDFLTMELLVNGKETTWSDKIAPVKISTAYTVLTDKDPRCIIVRDGNGRIIPNGYYENGRINFYVTSLGDHYQIGYAPKTFTDLGNYAWAEDAIIRLAARNVILGTSPTTYSPEMAITRADFVTLIVRAFGLQAESRDNFSDVPSSAYYAKEVSIAKALEIINGQGNNLYKPQSPITREDMMVILARAVEASKYSMNGDADTTFFDWDYVSAYAKSAVEKLAKAGIIAGDHGNIRPKGQTTRAEVAIILDRILFLNR